MGFNHSTWEPLPVTGRGAPIDLTNLGWEVDPQRALFHSHHLVLTSIAIVQCMVVTALVCWFPGKSYVRKQVINYCVWSGIFSGVYAFSGHSWISNIMAVMHNHCEIQLIVIALFNKKSWPKFRKYSYYYLALYAFASLFVSVKTGRRAWTMVGITWDGMFPLAFAVRYYRTRQKMWCYGIVAAVVHFCSIIVLLTMVDGFAQYFALLLPPTYIPLALFAFQYERLTLDSLPGMNGASKAQDGELPESAFFSLYAATVLALGIPLGGLLYGPRLLARLIPGV